MGLLDLIGMGADSRPTVSDLAIAEAGRAVQASATGQTYQADSLADLVRMALSGAGGGSFRGPFSYRQAVERVLDCDPLDTAVRLRARAASQVPIRLSRIKGTSKRDRARTRMSVVRALAAGGDTTRGSASATNLFVTRQSVGRTSLEPTSCSRSAATRTDSSSRRELPISRP